MTPPHHRPDATGRQPDVTADTCLTCSDQAVAAVVTELRERALAMVDAGTGPEEVSVALVAARVGDRVLVHAGEAIAVVPSAATVPGTDPGAEPEPDPDGAS